MLTRTQDGVPGHRVGWRQPDTRGCVIGCSSPSPGHFPVSQDAAFRPQDAAFRPQDAAFRPQDAAPCPRTLRSVPRTLRSVPRTLRFVPRTQPRVPGRVLGTPLGRPGTFAARPLWGAVDTGSGLVSRDAASRDASAVLGRFASWDASGRPGTPRPGTRAESWGRQASHDGRGVPGRRRRVARRCVSMKKFGG